MSTPFIAAFMPEVPGGLERIDRVVEPDVDAGNQAPAEAQVVALDQQDLALELRHLRHLRHAADRCPGPGTSAGCALPAKTNSTGRAGSPTMLAQPVQILEQQRGALVGGEAPAEADGEHGRVVRIGTGAAAGPGAPRCPGCASAARAAASAPGAASATSDAGGCSRRRDPASAAIRSQQCARSRRRCAPAEPENVVEDIGPFRRGRSARARRW